MAQFVTSDAMKYKPKWMSFKGEERD